MRFNGKSNFCNFETPLSLRPRTSIVINDKNTYMFNILTKIPSIFKLLRSKLICSQFKAVKGRVILGSINELHGQQYIVFEGQVCFADNLYLCVWDSPCIGRTGVPELRIGKSCNFGAMNHITCANHIIIGDNLLTGKNVTISDNAHGDTDYESLWRPPVERTLMFKGPVIIGNNVWIGDGAKILPGIKIGNGVVI